MMRLFEILVIIAILLAIFFINKQQTTNNLDKDEIKKIRETGEIPNFTDWQFKVSTVPIIVIIVILIFVVIYFLILS